MTMGDIPLLDLSLGIASDLSTSQYLAMTLGSGDTVTVASGAPVIGILQGGVDGSSHPTVGQVRVAGTSKILSDTSSIVIGSKIKLGSNGKAALSTDPSDVILGIALSANGGASVPVSVLLRL